ncbi:MAG: DUF4398 domain-containing protein [Gammaproteobacteria bacterium]
MATNSSKQGLDWIWAVGIVIMAALLVGCASLPPPNDALSTAEVALNRAIEAQAASYAPRELQPALEKLELAKRGIAAEHYEEARRFAEQARVDARLAEALALSHAARKGVQEVQETNDTLEREAEQPIY